MSLAVFVWLVIAIILGCGMQPVNARMGAHPANVSLTVSNQFRRDLPQRMRYKSSAWFSARSPIVGSYGLKKAATLFATTLIARHMSTA